MGRNYVSEQLEISEVKARADEHVKTLLAARPFLAWTIKGTVHEVKDYSIEEIENMIEGEPLVGTVPVDPGQTNHPKIEGLNTEDKVPFEGATYYDVLTYIRVPGSPSSVKILINVEGQNDTSPGYDIVTRGVYYGARRISAQKNTEFIKSNYDDIKKVYSIWICFDSKLDERNTITEYAITKKNIVGIMPDSERYDLMSIVFIRLGGDIDSYDAQSLQKLLMTIFSEHLSYEQKRDTISNEFGISMTDEEASEVRTMCNWSDGVERRATARGLAKGMEQGLEQGLKQGLEQGLEQGRMLEKINTIDRLVEQRGMSVEEACKFMEISIEDYMANKDTVCTC